MAANILTMSLPRLNILTMVHNTEADIARYVKAYRK